MTDTGITASTFESTIETGTAPFTVASTTLVSNLNADKLDGQEGTYYLDYTNFTNTPDATLTLATSGDGISGSDTFTANQSTDTTFTVTVSSASTNQASTLVYRDASGGFSAGIVTATSFVKASNSGGFLLADGTEDTNTYLTPTGDGSNLTGVGLDYFEEAQRTTSPNNVDYLSSLTGIGATDNIDVAIVPKGTGAILGNISDGNATGGNKRGDLSLIHI